MAATTRAKCYIHEMRDPLNLPFEPHKYNICVICQLRLLEMAKSNFRFERNQHVVRFSTQSELTKESV
jgi:hypothetical protein